MAARRGLGGLAGLQDPAVMEAKRGAETRLRAVIPTGGSDPWAEVRSAIKVSREIFDDLGLLEYEGAFNCRQFDIARTLVRLADETAKPNADRLREYRESALDSLKQHLFSEAPIYNDFETIKLADSLSLLMEKKGGDHPLVLKDPCGEIPGGPGGGADPRDGVAGCCRAEKTDRRGPRSDRGKHGYADPTGGADG